jgi:hypothetical protein
MNILKLITLSVLVVLSFVTMSYPEGEGKAAQLIRPKTSDLFR